MLRTPGAPAAHNVENNMHTEKLNELIAKIATVNNARAYFAEIDQWAFAEQLFLANDHEPSGREIALLEDALGRVKDQDVSPGMDHKAVCEMIVNTKRECDEFAAQIDAMPSRGFVLQHPDNNHSGLYYTDECELNGLPFCGLPFCTIYETEALAEHVAYQLQVGKGGARPHLRSIISARLDMASRTHGALHSLIDILAVQLREQA